MRVVAGDPEWVAQRIGPGGERGFGPCTSLAVEHDGEIIAGVVYHNWCPEDRVIEMSAAAVDRRWLARPVLHRVFEYPFDDVGVYSVVARIDPEAKHIRRMWRTFGAIEVELPHLRGPGKSELLLILTADAWKGSKFMRPRDGKTQAANPA